MAIGNGIVTKGQLDNQVAQLAMGMRSNAELVLRLWSYANGLGLAGLQAAPLNYSAADAQAYLDAVNHMATVAQVFQGTATQTPAFNFEDSLIPVTGPF
jgi:rhamnogalacturonyl hydrolase YesR